MKEVVHVWLVNQSKKIFSDGIQKLVSHWTKRVEKERDYVEKWYACKFYIAVVLI
jgi:hypothetical protein